MRDYFHSRYKESVIDRAPPKSLAAAAASSGPRRNHEWALRLGAAPHEARIFSGLRDRHEIWDYASAFMARAGILRFQPWIARDAEDFVTRRIEMPLDVPYDSIHVRRGDKLEKDAKHFVIKYWQDLGKYDNETGWTPRNYIPLSHYLSHFQGEECDYRLVYVATDDPAEVRREIDALPKDHTGRVLAACQRFRLLLAPPGRNASLGFHIRTGAAKGDCDDRYERNVAAIADLMILAKSDLFVGEFNSNWGRLVRTFRLYMNNDANLVAGARPVLERRMKVAWGPRQQSPPGW